MKQNFLRFTPFIIIAGILITGSLIYSNTLQSPFVFDDLPFIVANQNIKDLSDIKAIWQAAPVSSRFVAFYTFALNYHFGGENVWGYHVVNIAIHLINAVMVFWLMMLTPTSIFGEKRSQIGVGAVIALLFLTHPIQTQSVTYITQRFTSLATFFFLLSLCCYVFARLKKRKLFYVLSLIATVLAMFTKQITFTLPAVIFLYDIFFLKKKEERIPVYWFILPLFFLIIAAQHSFRASDVLSIEHQSGSYLGEPIERGNYLLTQFRVIMIYIRLMLVPVNQNLLYEFAASKSFFEPATAFCFIGLLAIFLSALFLRRRTPLLSFGIFWFFITLSVESSIIVIRHVIFEHRVYLPSVGFFMAFTAGLHALILNRKYFIGLATLMILILSVLTWQRNVVWQSAAALWEDVVAKSPGLMKARLNLAVVYTQEKRYMDAIKVYDTMLKEAPIAQAFGNRGNVYFHLGGFDMAIADYTKSLSIVPQSARTLTNRGDAYLKKGDHEKAIADFSQAIVVNPQYYLAFSHRGNVYRLLKKDVLALRDYNESIKLNPFQVDPFMGIGAIYFMRKEYEKAVDYFSEVLKLDPKNVDGFMNRGSCYGALGDNGLAINDYEKALKLAPQNGQIYYNRAIVYRKMGKVAQAQEDFERAKALGYEIKGIR